MDRRFALAIVLSFLVLMAFQVWFAPDKPEVQEGSIQGSSQARTETPASPPEPSSPSTFTEAVPAQGDTLDEPPETLFESPEETAEEETVQVDTPRYDAVFTSRGGKLESWDLKDYHTQSGDPVRLVNGGAELGLRLETETEVFNLDNVIFTHRWETGPEGSRNLVFEAALPSGLQVAKTYTLPPDGYAMGLRVDIRGAGSATGYRLTWDGGIPPAEQSHKQYDSSVATLVLKGKDKETIRPGSFKNESSKVVEGNIRWAGVRNKYFLAVMVPPPETTSRVVATGNHEAKITGAQLAMPLLQGRAQDEFLLYLGPMEHERLKALGHDLEQAVDLGWKIFRPISSLLLTVMVWMHGFIPNYGIVIIIISALTKVLFYPLTRSSFRSMKAMQALQPQMKEVREKYKKDPKRMQAETMELYKKHKVNPLGGCLPMLLQMPVFIALYSVLANSITMRQAPFMLWIQDLSTPDTLLTIGGFALHVLPIVMFLTTVVQQKLTPAPDPRQKMMGYMMPFVMLFIFYSFPAGLNLYWTVNNVLTVIQQWNIHREPMAEPVPQKA